MSLEDKWMIAQMNKQLYEAYCKLEQKQKDMVELEKTIGELRRELEDLKWKEVRFEETTGGVTAA
jgi:polyhydroxyalkanoate synthesis regulator phasin